MGIVRGVIGFPLEQPLESIKTLWQAKPYFRNELHIAKEIFMKKGFIGYYSGSIPNFTRMIVKNMYRYPLMIYLPL